MRRLLIMISLAMAAAGCVAGPAASTSGGASSRLPAASGGGGLTDIEFAWCKDLANLPTVSKAARSVGVDLDHLQATYTSTSGGSIEAYDAALRADPGYISACRAAHGPG